MRLTPKHKSKSEVKKPEVKKPTVRIRRKQEVVDDTKSNGEVSASPSTESTVDPEKDMFVPSKPKTRAKKKQVTKEPIPIPKPARAQKPSQSETSNKLNGLAKLISSVAKKHGEGSLIQMNSASIKPIDAISSGSIGLDYALGVGGYPRGRIVEIYGPASAGKCLTADTFVASEFGLITIGELFEKVGEKATCTSSVIDVETKLLNKDGEVETGCRLFKNNRRPVYRITTRTGTFIDSTANHKHLVMSSSGNWVWKTTAKLTDDDYLVCNRTEIFGNGELSSNEAYGIGVLVADGCFQPNKICITNDDPDVRNAILEYVAKSVGKQPIEYEKGNSKDYHFNSKELVSKFYTRLGISPGLAKDKVVPFCVRTAAKDSVRAFLQGYFDCEAYFSTKASSIEVCSASRELLSVVKQLLNMFGVLSSMNDKVVAGYEQNDYYRLFISGDSARTYKRVIGSRSAKINSKLEEFSDVGMSTNIDSIPNCKELLRDLRDASESTREHDDVIYDPISRGKITYSRLEQVLSKSWSDCAPLQRLREIGSKDYFYDKVSTVEFVGEEPTFDIEMPKTHSFVANGIITHNSSLTLHAIAECQKAGGVAAFIDAEHALDLKYARNLGVDTEQLLFSQPDYGEQALDIVDEIVKANIVDLIVVDSVAALTPKAELEGDMEKNHVGLQARMMSQALRKLTAIVSKTDSSLIFINQIREKVGVTWGSNETTPGGRSLKFYCSVRVDIRRMSSIKKSDAVVGNRVKVKITKNKLAPPHQECQFDIIFGEGINSDGDLVDIATGYGLIEKSGSWFSYKGIQLGQGRDGAVKALNEDTAMKKEIEDEIRKGLFGSK